MGAATVDVYSRGTFWLTAVLVVLTIGAIAVSVYLFRRQVPKRRLGYQLGPSLSMLASPYAQQLEVWAAVGAGRDDGPRQRLRSPHVSTIIIGNTGRLDIATSMFDAGRPIVVTFGPAQVKVLGVLDQVAPHNFTIDLVDNDLRLGPGLLRKNDRASVTVLTDGEPEFAIDAPLLDFDVRASEFALIENSSPGRTTSGAAPSTVISVAVAGFSLGMFLTAGLLFLASNADGPTPDQARVPEVVGERQSDAIQSLQAERLDASVLPTRITSPVPAGDVLATFPAQGDIVDKNTNIYLVISSGP